MSLKPEYARALSEVQGERGPIACAGCRTCCLGDTITLLPGEDVSQYETEFRRSAYVLRKGDDGNCIYLADAGCSIYDRQPQMCRAMDCRAYAVMVSRLSAAARAIRRADPLKGPVIEEGRIRLTA